MNTEHLKTPGGKPRARALNIRFEGTPGAFNAITDVAGIEVGYTTLIEGTDVRTGVTGIHPRGPANASVPVAAGYHSQNGNGEMTGVSWINEAGFFSGPVAITNTHAVGIAHAGIVAWMIKHHPLAAEEWLLPVAAETWDGYLNDINGHHVTEQAALAEGEADVVEQDLAVRQPDGQVLGGEVDVAGIDEFLEVVILEPERRRADPDYVVLGDRGSTDKLPVQVGPDVAAKVSDLVGAGRVLA